MKPFARTVVIASLLAAQGLALAGPRHDGPPPRHWHHRHGGGGWGGWGLGLAIALPLIVLASEADRVPEPVYTPLPPAPAPAYAQPQPPAAPVPVVYPRNGQGSAQLEADQRDCNRRATTQPAAMADAGVFQRAVQACMDARGYSLR